MHLFVLHIFLILSSYIYLQLLYSNAAKNKIRTDADIFLEHYIKQRCADTGGESTFAPHDRNSHENTEEIVIDSFHDDELNNNKNVTHKVEEWASLKQIVNGTADSDMVFPDKVQRIFDVSEQRLINGDSDSSLVTDDITYL
jgi:hypothetical protein